jgi:hypothetical protein
MLAHREKKRGGGGAWVRWLAHTGREVSPSGLEDRCWRIGKEESWWWWWRLGSGGLRTPAEKFRPPGLKTDAGALGKWLFGFSPEGGIRTAGVRKPPDREHSSLLLSPEGDTERGD